MFLPARRHVLQLQALSVDYGGLSGLAYLDTPRICGIHHVGPPPIVATTPAKIDMFDRCVATIFATLFDKFPIRTRISFTTWPESLFDDTQSTADIARMAVVYQHSVSWLRDAGYLWAGEITESDAADGVLTPKALQVLKSVPSSLNQTETLGAWLQRAVKDGAKDAVQKGVAYALTLGVSAIAS